jgi:hypothetical protein
MLYETRRGARNSFSLFVVPSSGSLNSDETRGSLDSCMSCTTHSWIGSLFLSNQPLMLYWTCVRNYRNKTLSNAQDENEYQVISFGFSNHIYAHCLRVLLCKVLAKFDKICL